MPDTKKFLDATGTSYLWSKIKTQLDLKANVNTVEGIDTRLNSVESNLSEAQNAIAAIQNNGYDDTELRTLIGAKANSTDLSAVSNNVATLIGDDSDKSVRTIANEELAAQLISENADDALDTLQEIAAWIQAHPNDASAMSNAIAVLQNKAQLGTYDNSGVQTEYATVKAYVEGYVSNQFVSANLSQYALDANVTALESNVSALETLVGNTAVETQINNAITALDLAGSYDAIGSASAAENAAKSYADGLAVNYDAAGAASNVYDAIIALSSSDIDAAIANASS